MPAKPAAMQTQKAAQQPVQPKSQPAKAAPSPAKAAVQQAPAQQQQKNEPAKATHKQQPVQGSPKESQASKAAPATAPQQSAKAPLAKRASLTPSQQVEQQQILNILLDDAGKDWKPRDKTRKQPVNAAKQQGGKQGHKTTPVQKTTSKGPTQKAVQPSVAAKPASAPALVKRASLTPVQQLEQTQILNILLDDAGKDWKPRDKSPTIAPVPQKTGAQKAALVQNAQKSGAAPAVAAKPAPALVKRASLTPVQQAEQQQILNILIDDAGKDWKPRDKSMATCGISSFLTMSRSCAQATVQEASTCQGLAETQVSSCQSPAVAPKAAAVQGAKPALLTRRSSLTDAQKKEKREIMEILLDPYEFVPARITRRGSSTQVKADLHRVGNAVVVSNPPVDANEDFSGFETVKSRRTSIKEKKDLRTEQDAILSVLGDFKEPSKKHHKGNQQTPQNARPNPQTPTKTQPTQQQKVAPQATKHIQAKANQGRAKLAT
ncbi:hypothetical protein DYB37_010572 [Aphanomyces astaci]|uniref:Uncharacterized protein n=1 Tax=Aphanomyces astaci TaxID=112090 RepID=A0A3R7B989_APHAT|nr:hypothetical protein DYB37_010572 [Aphanomyces astaci]